VARTKMTRHELKEQDEITTSLEKFVEFSVARKNELIIAGAALVVVVAGLFGWSYYRTNRNNNAQMQLAQVFRAYDDTSKPDKQRFETTIAEAQKTVDAYGSLPAGAIAQYYIGLSQEGLGDSAKAMQSLQAAIDRGDTTIKGTAQFALAGLHKKHGEGPKAIEVYKQLYDSGNYSKAAVAYELALLYESTEQPNQARDYYQKIVTDFPDSPFRQMADEALRRMGVTVVPPPPAQKPS
jgi:predicted negative regulator of RcsB-dependent stress response